MLVRFVDSVLSRTVRVLACFAWLGLWTASASRSETPLSAAPGAFRVLSYNVLADPVHIEQRVPELLRLMRESEADIITLQEVAPWFAEVLLREAWVRPYHRAREQGKTVLAHEHMILSRFPVQAHASYALPGPQQRVAHIITITLNGVRTGVATCHLESLLDDGPIRIQQLDVFFRHLAEFEQALFAGDFNFGDEDRLETGAIPAAYSDVWLATHPAEPGFTWDVKRSRMARKASFPGEPSRRLDRILYRSSQWKPVSAEIVGNAPVPGSTRVFPSDHFGLLATFTRIDP